MKTAADIISEAPAFLQMMKKLFSPYFDITLYPIDHICYRVETNERYEALKGELEFYGESLSEEQINGRAITTFKLFNPITFRNQEIYCIELPSPRPDFPYPEGFEHIECVSGMSLEDFIQKFPDLRFDTSFISKSINRDIRLKMQDYVVKFHEQSLEEVITGEKLRSAEP